MSGYCRILGGEEIPHRLCFHPPDWGDHIISLRSGDTTVMEPGMTIHEMPGIWRNTLGFECREAVVITEKGCECLV